MYPLVVVLGVATVETRPTVWRTVVPLSVLGAFLAGYHSILQMTTNSCTFAGPCAVIQWRLPILGLTIPNLSLVAFILVTIAALGSSGVVPSWSENDLEFDDSS
jgi:disulfide bond formation protein DsbB